MPLTGRTIGQVSQMLGVPVPTLRSWELRYEVARPERTRGGHRRYRTADVEALQALNAAVARGIAPGTAAQALRGSRRDPEAPLELLTRLLDAAVTSDQPAVVQALEQGQAALGVESAVDRLLIPALREIGLRWARGELDVGTEHAVTSAVRRWIARCTGSTTLRAAPPVLLAAAPGNAHTVALEAFAMLLDRRGWPTCLLGADTPVDALLAAARRTAAPAAVVTAHQLSRTRPAVVALQALQASTALRLYYAGAAFDGPRHRRGLPGTYLGTDLPAAADVVERDLVDR